MSTHVVNINGVLIGGGHPVAIQSMTNTDTRDTAATVAQIGRLEQAGCEIVRVAVPDMDAAKALKIIKKQIHIPLVADIHFDYRLALAAIKNGADKLRLNPGNIGSRARVQEVAKAAKDAGIPIRVGVNGGSLEGDLLAKHGGLTAQAMAESALNQVNLLEACGFDNIVVSVKASDVSMMIDAYKIVAASCPYPLHIGVTEAGTPYKGAIRSAAGLGALLAMGLGSTLRVSLTGDPINEIVCAKEILQAMGLRQFGARVIACPTCGRAKIDVAALAAQVEAFCDTIKKPLTVAVMGCAVNGPGEARHADVGIAGGDGEGLLFSKGNAIGKVPEGQLEQAIIKAIQGMV
jgi:(E)-4-hydroxy-3-methylbut-2-enyl-diphosphate synthase